MDQLSREFEKLQKFFIFDLFGSVIIFEIENALWVLSPTDPLSTGSDYSVVVKSFACIYSRFRVQVPALGNFHSLLYTVL